MITEQQAMKIISHSRLHKIWLAAKNGEPLDGEETVLAQAMCEHPEDADIWDELDTLSDGEIIRDGVNTLLHISMHSMVENQLAQNTLPEVPKAMNSLLARGASRHEAIHAIAYEFSMELAKILQTKRPFNEIAYKRRLEKITRGKK